MACVQILSWHKRPWLFFQTEQKLKRSLLHRLRLFWLCGQSKINNRILLQIWQWSNLMEVETLGVHDHFNDRSRIRSRVRRGERGFMAWSAGAHVLTSWLRLGSNCLHRQSGCCRSIEKSGSPQHLRSISMFNITLFGTASFQGKSASRRYLQSIML